MNKTDYILSAAWVADLAACVATLNDYENEHTKEQQLYALKDICGMTKLAPAEVYSIIHDAEFEALAIAELTARAFENLTVKLTAK